MKSHADSHVERLMREGLSLLSGGRGREASLRFSRVLMGDPRHPEARRGEERVRALLGEEERLASLRLHEAREAFTSGHFDDARRLAAQALHLGADPVAVQSLFDRLDERAGRLASLATPTARAFAPLARPLRVGGLSRALVATAWALTIGLLLGLVATRWEKIVDQLARAPWPTTRPAPPATSLPAGTPGDTALGEARRLLLAGQAQGALRALDRIPTQDPNYPYARRLRVEAESALASLPATQ